jgi:hypothetical protein
MASAFDSVLSVVHNYCNVLIHPALQIKMETNIFRPDLQAMKSNLQQ